MTVEIDMTLADFQRHLNNLEQLARAATPGPWRQGSVELQHVFVPYAHAVGGGERVLLKMNMHFAYEADAAFIGGVGPDVVLDLVERFREAISRYAGLAEIFDEKCHDKRKSTRRAEHAESVLGDAIKSGRVGGLTREEVTLCIRALGIWISDYNDVTDACGALRSKLQDLEALLTASGSP